MKTYKVSVQWTMINEIDIEAHSLADAIEKVKEAPGTTDNGEYLSDSFVVDEEDTKRINGL